MLFFWEVEEPVLYWCNQPKEKDIWEI
jgi:hypothetical protein